MPNRAHVEWNGDQLIERVREAARAAIDDVTQEAAADAALSHWWLNHTGEPRPAGMLEENIRTEDAEIIGNHVSGRFGATYSGQKGHRSGFVGLFLEYRTPWLRPAADRHFPTLASKIRERLG